MPPISAPIPPLSPAPKRSSKRAPAEVRSVTFVVRLRPSERDHLAALADAHGVALADLIRRRLLEWRLPQPERSAEDARLYGVLHTLSLSLRNAGSNISGMAQAWHSGFHVEGESLIAEMTELRSLVDAIRNALVRGET